MFQDDGANRTNIFTCSGCKQGVPSIQGHDGSLNEQNVVKIESLRARLLAFLNANDLDSWRVVDTLNDLSAGAWCVWVEQSFTSFHFVCERAGWIRRSVCFELYELPSEKSLQQIAHHTVAMYQWERGDYNYPLPMIIETKAEGSFWG